MGDGHVGDPSEPVTLSLTITDSANARRTALHHAGEAIDAINTIQAWSSAVKTIKWVMDTVSPVAEVCPILFLPVFLLANFRGSADTPCKSSMEPSLKDS